MIYEVLHRYFGFFWMDISIGISSVFKEMFRLRFCSTIGTFGRVRMPMCWPGIGLGGFCWENPQFGQGDEGWELHWSSYSPEADGGLSGNGCDSFFNFLYFLLLLTSSRLSTILPYSIPWSRPLPYTLIASIITRNSLIQITNIQTKS